MDRVIADLKHQLHEVSEKVYKKRRCLELIRKDRKDTMELQKEEAEVPLIEQPDIFCLPS